MVRKFIVSLAIILSFAAVGELSAEGERYYEAEDFSKAMTYFKEAANRGDIDAQYNVALMYRLGRGVEKDSEEAAYWCQKAAGRACISRSIIWAVCTKMDVA